jgi:hypothetical protein
MGRPEHDNWPMQHLGGEPHMKFFLPPSNDAETAERSYQEIKKFNEKQTGWQISHVRYYEINYRHNGQAMRARVGELDPLENQTVIAIFKAKHSHGPYLSLHP